MGKIGGFLEIERETPSRRPVKERLRDWREYEHKMPEDKLRAQGARCMDCGIPFCHKGCPLGNIIPDWNDLVYRGRFKDAIARLHMTNNFPEFTGRVCPAPCEEACVLNINSQPVTIKLIEKTHHRPRLRRRLGHARDCPLSGPARRSRWSARVRRDWPARSNWRAPATTLPCSSAPTGSAVC